MFIIHLLHLRKGAWGSVVVKALRCWSGGLGINPQWCHWGFFPRLTTESCALGSTQPLNMSARKIPGSKAGRCVRLTTYHLLVPNVKKIRGLNLSYFHRPVQACSGTALLYFLLATQQIKYCHIIIKLDNDRFKRILHLHMHCE
jgi:hypothetical protein